MDEWMDVNNDDEICESRMTYVIYLLPPFMCLWFVSETWWDVPEADVDTLKLWQHQFETFMLIQLLSEISGSR